MSNTTYATYLIPSSRLEGLKKSVNRMANKINKGRVKAEFVPELKECKSIIMVVRENVTKLFQYDPLKEYDGDYQLVSYTWVTLHYPMPIESDWQLLAVYNWDLDLATDTHVCYTHRIDDIPLLKEHQNVEYGRCDHCNVNRARSKAMLITKNFIQYKVVGTSCLNDFIGQKTATSLISMYDFILDIRNIISEPCSNIANISLFPVREVLELAKIEIDQNGWVKSGSTDECGYPLVTTSDNVKMKLQKQENYINTCLLYTSPSPRDS